MQTGCRDCFSKALFFVGELGVNDYSYVWNAGKTEDQVMTYVPKVVKKIALAVEVYIYSGISLILLWNICQHTPFFALLC
jgi:hypothetical protein